MSASDPKQTLSCGPYLALCSVLVVSRFIRWGVDMRRRDFLLGLSGGADPQRIEREVKELAAKGPVDPSLGAPAARLIRIIAQPVTSAPTDAGRVRPVRGPSPPARLSTSDPSLRRPCCEILPPDDGNSSDRF